MKSMPPNFVQYDLKRMLDRDFVDNFKFPDKLMNLWEGLNDNRGIIYLSGANGVGKDTVLNSFFDNNSDVGVKKFIRTTTRPMRQGEEQGQDNFFVSEEELLDNWQDYVMITRYPANNELYGIDARKIYEHMNGADPVLFISGIDFAPFLKKFFPSSTSVYILPPSLAEMEERLKKRGTDEEQLKKRTKVGEEEILSIYSTLYSRKCYVNNVIDVPMINNVLDNAVDELSDVVKKSLDYSKSGIYSLDFKIGKYHEVLRSSN